LLAEAGEKIDEEGAEGAEAGKVYRLLETEFHDEVEAPNRVESFRGRVESLYTRVTGISGKPLTDGYHFGETILNDYGRPYQEGVNSLEGFSGWMTSGRWVGYVRGEYQHAPSAPALSDTARQTIASVDSIPVVPPASPFAAVNRMQLLDAYVGMNFENWQVTFGKQSLWWGPGDSGPMMFSDNVEPINMFRINRVSPFQLPSIFKRLGPGRAEFFIGQLDGHHFVDTSSGITGSWSQSLNPQPFIDGWKLSFRPSPNFEFGVTYTTIFGGVGNPATPRTFVQSLFDRGGDLPDGSSKSSRENGLDFSYRIPKLRKWLTLYGEGFAHDQIIFFIDPKEKPLPFGYPDRAAWRAGIYVPMFPGIRKLDFRVEGGYTSNPLGPSGGYAQGFYYTANRYLNGYTNNGNLLGSWLGRAGQGEQAWTNYWFTPRSRIQLSFRHQNVSQQYLPGGGSLTDVGARGDYWVGPVGISASVQHERWLFPVIQPNVSRNVTATVQILFEPRKLFQRSAANDGATLGTGDRP
jgi:Capsule assembly protein Wzi